jgi:hypothetical protein
MAGRQAHGPSLITALGPSGAHRSSEGRPSSLFQRRAVFLTAKAMLLHFFAAFQIVSNNVLFDPCTHLACVMKTIKLIEVAKWGLRTA